MAPLVIEVTRIAVRSHSVFARCGDDNIGSVATITGNSVAVTCKHTPPTWLLRSLLLWEQE
jgi:hypothetical protein